MADLLPCVRACDLWGPNAAACLDFCALRATSKPFGDFPGGGPGFGGLPVSVSIGLAIVLVPLSGLFAGLTLGLLSLDLVGLRILASAGEPEEQEYAKAIIPVRKQGNLLLCTLLLGNTVINSAISILLADITTGPIGLLASTGLILLFGEILPQSIATRHGLKIGAQCIWIVRLFMFLLAPITYPLAALLDRMVGRDIGMVYSVEELKRLIEIHVTDPWAQAESGLTRADQQLILGALDYKRKRVRDVMTSLDKTFMLDRSTRLNFQTMLAIYKSGFTRIPVYEGVRQNIVGILYAKDLILIDSDDEVEVGAVVSFRGRGVARVSENDTLDGVFKRFITGNNHMLIACCSDSASDGSLEGAVCRPTGLITLEDVLEEVLQEEIVDETDIYEDVDRRVLRRGGNRVDIASFLTMFEHKLPHTNALSVSERQAVIAFLSVNVEEFGVLAQFGRPLEGLIDRAEVVEREVHQRDVGQGLHSPHYLINSANNSGSPAGVGEWGLARMMSRAASHTAAWEDATAEEMPPLVLYQRGELSDAFTLILQGRVLIRTGQEGFELEMGPWSVLGNRSLTQSDYQPDFDAVALPPFRLLRIRRADYYAAVQATTLDPHIGRQQRGRFTAGKPVPGFDAVVAPPPHEGINGAVRASPLDDGVAARPRGGEATANGDSCHMDGSLGDRSPGVPVAPSCPDFSAEDAGGGGEPAASSLSTSGGTVKVVLPYKASSPIHGVNNAAEAGAVASEASKADSARAEAALKTPKLSQSGVWHSGQSFKKSRLGHAEGPAASSMCTLHEDSPGTSPQVKTLAEGLADMVSRSLFRSASEADTARLEFREPLLPDDKKPRDARGDRNSSSNGTGPR